MSDTYRKPKIREANIDYLEDIAVLCECGETLWGDDRKCSECGRRYRLRIDLSLKEEETDDNGGTFELGRR